MNVCQILEFEVSILCMHIKVIDGVEFQKPSTKHLGVNDYRVNGDQVFWTWNGQIKAIQIVKVVTGTFAECSSHKFIGHACMK